MGAKKGKGTRQATNEDGSHMGTCWVRFARQRVGVRIREVQGVVGYTSGRKRLGNIIMGQVYILKRNPWEQRAWEQRRRYVKLMSGN